MEVPKTLNHKLILLAIGLIAIGVIFRLVPHEANFAPVAAIALLSGVMFGRKYALLVPLGILLVSDMILGLYSSFVFTWLAFGLIAIYGTLFRQASFTRRVLLGGFGSAVIFFIVSNLGTWVAGHMYPLSLAGLIDCFYMALPFFRSTLVSDLVYSGLLFGALAWIADKRSLATKQLATAV